MACDTQTRAQQTLSERKREVQETIRKVATGLVAGRIRVLISPKGAISFQGLDPNDRNGITDGCIFRLILKQEPRAADVIRRAEMVQGRKVSADATHHGWHTHDAGKTWETHGGGR